ncbi:hypothetical protein BDP81DRAFT_80154 [Colletotrichum phormii]|uniref:Uncharacterized protein n=1 Tax=Colletotrichum phormii TaxID=359342 RepID=A0AAJ0A378_9PEZI|nr:uncharacterized protein BDP81DRAFT_80154 [Colletotrichum phormii]KAK1654251.1 hypothetical protein BDP81DRAFT_80154 [Colletotrichum phormii]
MGKEKKDVIISAHNWYTYPPTSPSYRHCLLCMADRGGQLSRHGALLGCVGCKPAKPRGGCIPQITLICPHSPLRSQVLEPQKSSPTSERVGGSSAAPQARRSRKMQRVRGRSPEGIPVMRASVLEPRLGGDALFSYQVPNRCRCPSKPWLRGSGDGTMCC